MSAIEHDGTWGPGPTAAGLSQPARRANGLPRLGRLRDDAWSRRADPEPTRGRWGTRVLHPRELHDRRGLLRAGVDADPLVGALTELDDRRLRPRGHRRAKGPRLAGRALEGVLLRELERRLVDARVGFVLRARRRAPAPGSGPVGPSSPLRRVALALGPRFPAEAAAAGASGRQDEDAIMPMRPPVGPARRAMLSRPRS
jgi:hypothetical protein